MKLTEKNIRKCPQTEEFESSDQGASMIIFKARTIQIQGKKEDPKTFRKKNAGYP